MTQTVSVTVQIRNRLGMHARAAAKLVDQANRFSAHVELEKDGQTADAKSIMGVLLLCGGQGSQLVIRATGEDAKAALEALVALVENRFGEDE